MSDVEEASYGYGLGKFWEIGIALLPDWRGRGIGWQAALCDYLFAHTPTERIEACCAPSSSATANGAKAGCTARRVPDAEAVASIRWPVF